MSDGTVTAGCVASSRPFLMRFETIEQEHAAAVMPRSYSVSAIVSSCGTP